jgi:hypothetical protein
VNAAAHHISAAAHARGSRPVAKVIAAVVIILVICQRLRAEFVVFSFFLFFVRLLFAGGKPAQKNGGARIKIRVFRFSYLKFGYFPAKLVSFELVECVTKRLRKVGPKHNS